jgi:ribosomal protein S21
MIIKCEVKLEKNKCSNKVYFDKKLKQFTNLVRQCGIMEDIRLRRSHMKPSVRKKLAPQIAARKWKYYNFN